jgi:hypothetical protein
VLYALVNPATGAAHPLLTGPAAQLAAPGNELALEAQARVAERLLGFRRPAAGSPAPYGAVFADPAAVPPVVASADAQDAADAVALQVSYQVALGLEVFYAQSEGRGGRSISYRDVGIGVHPVARALVDALPDAGKADDPAGLDPDEWGMVTTLRGGAGAPAGYVLAWPATRWGDVVV